MTDPKPITAMERERARAVAEMVLTGTKPVLADLVALAWIHLARQAEQRWVPVSERLPEPGAIVFSYWAPGVITTHEPFYGVGQYQVSQWVEPLDHSLTLCPPTHWMPLPAQPEV